MSEKPKRLSMPDAVAINPRYKGAMMSDVARALVTDPKVRERLEERWDVKRTKREERSG